jgi:2-polyprenyl-3-methyl-5-hydroxy-6-metoxy-1,4-benzoquinol methylase
MATQELDSAKVEAFAERALGIVNDGMLALMLGLGYRTGLFDVLATLPPSTSDEIAEKAGLEERYVREWLGSLTVGGIVSYDPESRTYALPAEHAALLTHAAGPDNMGAFADSVAGVAPVYLDIVECFRSGGGVPYSKFTNFHEDMKSLSGPIFDATLLEHTLPLAGGIVERLQQGIDVLDAGCGGGHAVGLMARAFPNSRFTGYDFEPEAIELARAEAAELENTRFEVVDLSRLDERGRYDLITAFDMVHDQAQPRRVLANLARALRPEGTFLMIDIAASSRLEENLEHPLGPFLYGVSVMHCMTVSLAQGGEGLGTVWGEQKALELLEEAGFADAQVKHLEGDPINSVYVATKP